MNIENFNPFEVSLQELFQKQKGIKFLYEPESKDIFQNFDIDSFEDQEVFKKYSWRIVEELTEALEDSLNKPHFQEELIDSFNFLIELYLLYGWDFDKFKWEEEINFFDQNDSILTIIYQLGITCNLLKNRQWRQSQYLVDLYIFEQRFIKIWDCFIFLFNCVGLNKKKVLDLWSLKYQVNLFRIETKY